MLGFFIGAAVASIGWFALHRWQLSRVDVEIEARREALSRERVRRILDRGGDERSPEWVEANTPLPL